MLSNKPAAPAEAAQVRTPPVLAKPAHLQIPSPARTPIAAGKPPTRDFLSLLAFYFGLMMLFARFSVISEVIALTTGINSRLLYFVGPPAILAMLLSGGVQRTLRERAGMLFLAFYIWVLIASPFSSWPGYSVFKAIDYGRTNVVLLFVVGSLAMSWKDIRTIFYTLAAAACVNLLTAKALADQVEGRITMQTANSTIANSNDLAAHVLLALPFLLYVVMDRKRSVVIKAAVFGAIGYGLWIVLGTGSRGGMIGLAVAILVLFWQASRPQKIAVVLGTILLASVIWPMLPSLTKARLESVLGGEHEEAQQSQTSRIYLFKKSIEYTIRYPVFGIGSDQFATFEGYESRSEGKHGNWHTAHNTFTQFSSENGIPAFFFGAGSLIAAIVGVRRIYRAARQRKLIDLIRVCQCYLLAMAGYLTAIMFLSHAYSFYLPAMVGLAISIITVGKRELNAAAPLTAPARSVSG